MTNNAVSAPHGAVLSGGQMRTYSDPDPEPKDEGQGGDAPAEGGEVPQEGAE